MPVLAGFVGTVTCQCDPACPLPLQLRGEERGARGTILIAHLAGAAPGDMPATFQDAELEATSSLSGDDTRGPPTVCVLTSVGKRYPITTSRIMVHRDVHLLAESVIKPRPVRWRMRIFWRLVFLLMKFPPGRRLLLRRYRS